MTNGDYSAGCVGEGGIGVVGIRQEMVREGAGFV